MKDFIRQLTFLVKSLVVLFAFIVLLTVSLFWIILIDQNNLGYIFQKSLPVVTNTTKSTQVIDTTAVWQAPDTASIPRTTDGDLIRYGRELIAHTSRYLGPNGEVQKVTNGMNCQNCHLDAGTKPWGNNYSAVYSTYPKFRARSGTNETIIKRISDCFERSLNGAKPDSNSHEMQAMVAYMRWLGANVPKGTKPQGAGLKKVTLMDRAADPAKGLPVYQQKCASCHGKQGEGIFASSNESYLYPPLWGKHSYNDGAGLFRLSNFASYVKNNMPYGATADNPILSDQEAWDLAAFVNSQPRPHKDQSKDWKDISKKPVDFPFGPYADAFDEKQHKYGPYQTMSK